MSKSEIPTEREWLEGIHPDDPRLPDTTQGLDEILIRFGVYIAEYANFGSPFNSDDENIAGAEALYQTSLQEAKQAILDWHNKQIEAVLDRLASGENYWHAEDDVDLVPLSAIEAERNKLRGETK